MRLPGTTHIGLLALALGFLLISPATVLADGKAFPGAAFPDIPKIPAQRAILIWRGGNETLIVESTMQTPSPQVGWVLPLPAEPNNLAVAEAGMLTSMSSCQRPRITTSLGDFVWYTGVVLIFAGPLSLHAILVREPRRGVARFWQAAALWAFILILMLLYILTTATTARRASAGGLGVSGVSVSSMQRVGNYEVAVLRADSGTALDQWLQQAGLKGLDAADRTAVEDYIARKWCFVVAAMAKDGNEATPHPIAATFRAPAPVYPMKLTGLSGSSTRVELFVIADRRADAKGIDCVASDTYRPMAGDPIRSARQTSHYRSSEIGLVVGSPDVCDLMWDGCVVTALSADLSPGQMKSDLAISLSPPSAHRSHRFNESAKHDLMGGIVVWGSLAALVALAVACNGRRKPSRGMLIFIGCILLATGVSVTVAGLAVEPLPVRTGWHGYPALFQRRSIEAAMVIAQAKGGGSAMAPLTPADVKGLPELLKKHGPRDLAANPFTGEEMRLERSPGNYSVRTVDGKTFLCLYDGDGTEYRLAGLPIEPGPSTLPAAVAP